MRVAYRVTRATYHVHRVTPVLVGTSRVVYRVSRNVRHVTLRNVPVAPAPRMRERTASLHLLDQPRVQHLTDIYPFDYPILTGRFMTTYLVPFYTYSIILTAGASL